MEPVIIGSRETKLELTCVERRNGDVEIVGAVGIHELASQLRLARRKGRAIVGH